MSYPGKFSKFSECSLVTATTIAPTGEVVYLTGTTTLGTITPPNLGGEPMSLRINVVPLTGNVATDTTGNIAVAVTMPQNRATVLVFKKSTGVWYPGAIS